MLGVRQLLRSLGKRNLEHATERGACYGTGTFLDADIDTDGGCTLDRKGLARASSRETSGQARAGSQAPVDSFAIDGDADNPTFCTGGCPNQPEATAVFILSSLPERLHPECRQLLLD
jgi:hypothetical protein